MSWARGIDRGREVGYAVEAECDHPDCHTMIDRGVSYRCGWFTSDAGCGGFFCEKHRSHVIVADDNLPQSVCDKCYQLLREGGFIDEDDNWIDQTPKEQA